MSAWLEECYDLNYPVVYIECVHCLGDDATAKCYCNEDRLLDAWMELDLLTKPLKLREDEFANLDILSRITRIGGLHIRHFTSITMIIALMRRQGVTAL